MPGLFLGEWRGLSRLRSIIIVYASLLLPCGADALLVGATDGHVVIWIAQSDTVPSG